MTVVDGDQQRQRVDTRPSSTVGLAHAALWTLPRPAWTELVGELEASVSMEWHWTTCLLYATLYPDSLDARTFALRIADSSTSHALHCRRAVFEPSCMLVHLCGTLCPFISRTAIWLLQRLCAILSLISFLSTDFVSSAFGVWSHKRAV